MTELIINDGKSEEIVLILSDDELLLGGQKLKYEIYQVNPYFKLLRIGSKNYRFALCDREEKSVGYLTEGHYFRYSVQTRLEKAIDEITSHQKESQKIFDVKSPMPGLVLKIKKRSGDIVQANESVLILEAMKMENDIKSPSSGIIKELLADEKQSVEKGTLLFRIEQLTN